MAISLLGQYGAGRVFVDAENVRGTFKDSTFPGAFDGTPAQYAWARDVWGFLEILLDKASIIPNGSPDTAVNNQRYEALEKVVRDVFPVWDSGHIYAKGTLTLASDDKLYQSLQASNLNKDPVSSPLWWREFTAATDASKTEKGITYLDNQDIILSNSVGDLNNDIDFSGGKFVFDDGSGEALGSILTKKLDAVWAAGTNQGMLDIGTKAADQTYHIFAIWNPTSETSDYLASLSSGTPSLPGGYTKKELQGSILTDSSANIRLFRQYDKEFILDTPVNDRDITGIVPAVRNLITLTVPFGRKVKALTRMMWFQSGGTANTHVLAVTDPDQTDYAPTYLPPAAFDLFLLTQTNQTQLINAQIEVVTDASGQIGYRRGGAAVSTRLVIVTRGWIDYNLRVR